MKFSRQWAMPNKDTFSIPPIGDFVKRYLAESTISIDPFARNKRWATLTNDINPNTSAEYHLDAEIFLQNVLKGSARFDLGILDMPYSPRQISECYKEVGLSVGMRETQSAVLYSRVKSALAEVLTHNAVVLSFGWNTVGMGKKLGFEIVEIMTVCHGGAHNDTLCMAEIKTQIGFNFTTAPAAS